MVEGNTSKVVGYVGTLTYFPEPWEALGGNGGLPRTTVLLGPQHRVIFSGSLCSSGFGATRPASMSVKSHDAGGR